MVVRTFSKSYSLAGARCGYALGNEELINGLKTIKNSFNSYTINALTEGIAIKALEDQNYFLSNVDKIIATREDVSDKLRELGFEVLPSSSNFIFARHNKKPASEIYFQLKENGVLVRHFATSRINNFLRITIGSKEEMKVFLQKLKQILNS